MKSKTTLNIICLALLKCSKALTGKCLPKESIKDANMDMMLDKAFYLVEKVNRENLNESDYKPLFYKLKKAVGSHFTASMIMSMAFVIQRYHLNSNYLGMTNKKDELYLNELKINVKVDRVTNINLYSSGNIIGETVNNENK